MFRYLFLFFVVLPVLAVLGIWFYEGVTHWLWSPIFSDLRKVSVFFTPGAIVLVLWGTVRLWRAGK